MSVQEPQEINIPDAPLTASEAAILAAQQGIRITGRDRQEIARLQAEERKRFQEIRNEQLKADSFVRRFNRAFPILISGLINLGDILMTVGQTLITGVGVPLILVILLFVEQERAQRGMMMFDATWQIAQFGAWAIVLLNLTLECSIEFVERQHGWHRPQDTKATLRTQWQAFVYYIKFWDHTNPEPTSPAKAYRELLRLTTFTIIGLSLAGSMSAAIASTQGTWSHAIVAILTTSTLSQALSWFGGTMFALVAVLAAQRLSGYVAMRAMATYDNMKTPDDEWDQDRDAALDEIASQYIIAKTRMEEQRRLEAGKSVNPTLGAGSSHKSLGFNLPATASLSSSLNSDEPETE